jgi:hypothetical protein
MLVGMLRVVEPLACRPAGLGQELLQTPGGDHLGARVERTATGVPQLVAVVGCDEDRAVFGGKLDGVTVELDLSGPIDDLPVFGQRRVVVLRQVSVVLKPGLDPQVVVLAPERVGGAVDPVADRLGGVCCVGVGRDASRR